MIATRDIDVSTGSLDLIAYLTENHMTDIIDIAQQRQLDQVQRKPKDYTTPSCTECECGNEIPPERQAYGGITLCIECQSALERTQGQTQ